MCIRDRVYAGESQLDGNAYIIADSGGGGACAAAEAIYSDDVCAAPRNAARYGGDVVNGGDFYDHRLFIVAGLL